MAQNGDPSGHPTSVRSEAFVILTQYIVAVITQRKVTLTPQISAETKGLYGYLHHMISRLGTAVACVRLGAPERYSSFNIRLKTVGDHGLG